MRTSMRTSLKKELSSNGHPDKSDVAEDSHTLRPVTTEDDSLGCEGDIAVENNAAGLSQLKIEVIRPAIDRNRRDVQPGNLSRDCTVQDPSLFEEPTQTQEVLL